MKEWECPAVRIEHERVLSITSITHAIFTDDLERARYGYTRSTVYTLTGSMRRAALQRNGQYLPMLGKIYFHQSFFLCFFGGSLGRLREDVPVVARSPAIVAVQRDRSRPYL